MRSRPTGKILHFDRRQAPPVSSASPRPVVTLHLEQPIVWAGRLIENMPLGNVAAGKLAAREADGAAYASVAAAVTMSGYPAEMLQFLGPEDAARLLFVSMALIDYGDD